MRSRGLYLILLSFLAFQCAKQTAPTGGPKDETPPKLQASLPRHEQTNVRSPKLELFFDEPIQLNNPREQIIITPTVGKKFEVTYSKNKVQIDLKAARKENTTYNINFREAIQDLTEKNPAVVKLAFSTGPYIDSLEIRGKVLDAQTEAPQHNIMVAAVEVSDTFNIFKHPASWITLTNKNGSFALENMKPGNYFVYAFDDKSKNLTIESKSERYGIIAKNISLQANSDSLKIRIFKLDVNKLKLLSARTTFAYFNIRFSKGLLNYSVTPVDTTREVYASLEQDFSTIKLYDTNKDLDSLQVKIHASDSLENHVDSLIYIKFPKKEATRDKLTAKLDKVTLKESNSILSAEITFSKPITTFNIDSTVIVIDSTKSIPLASSDYHWQNKNSKLVITKTIDLNLLFVKDSTAKDPKAKPTIVLEPQLVFKKGSFVSIEADTAVTLSTPVKLTKIESTAIIESKVNTSENFITQVINRQGAVVQEQLNQKETKFENLPPDTYQLRIIVDLNKNGKWDAGDFSKRIEPEPIVYYRNSKGLKDIPLKANWQLGPLLITY